MRFHVFMGSLVCLFGWGLRVSIVEWCLLALCIGCVMAAECVNSGLERLSDRVSREDHYLIKAAKDAAAGGVLLVASASAVIGMLIFIPKLLRLFGWDWWT